MKRSASNWRRELSRRSTGRTFYVLDEPTTGLHFADIHKLLEVLQRLVQTGNTVLVIEHNLDVIKTADYLIDLGPEGGDKGGTIVGVGTPEELAANKDSYTGSISYPCCKISAPSATTRATRPPSKRWRKKTCGSWTTWPRRPRSRRSVTPPVQALAGRV